MCTIYSPGSRYRVVNDCFMELCGVPDGRGNYASNTQNINTQLTVAYLRFHLNALIDMAGAADSDEVVPPQLEEWVEILAHLPPLPTTTANVRLLSMYEQRIIGPRTYYIDLL